MTPRRAANCCGPIDDLLDPELFRALGDPTRLLLLACLAKCGRACSVTEIAECCSVDLSVVSRHLALLERAKVLFGEKSTAGELELKRFPVLGAYELALKCSHVFNLLDARGAISVTERVGVMARIRTLVVGVAKAYVAQGEKLAAVSQAG